MGHLTQVSANLWYFFFASTTKTFFFFLTPTAFGFATVLCFRMKRSFSWIEKKQESKFQLQLKRDSNYSSSIEEVQLRIAKKKFLEKKSNWGFIFVEYESIGDLTYISPPNQRKEKKLHLVYNLAQKTNVFEEKKEDTWNKIKNMRNC